MASPRAGLQHVFDGGWSTDQSPRALTPLDGSGLVRIPYLLAAENIVYELDGGVRKAPGAAKVNSSALESGADIVGCYDAWFSGTSGTPAQHRIVHVGTKVKADDGDGSFSDILTGLTAGAIPTYTMLEDLLVMGSTVDVPKYWDGSSAGSLGGSPPSFSICTTHKNRIWAAGVASNPSRVYYSPLLDPANASAEGWGYISVDPDDGDVITGLWSYKNELIVFKGPHKGSIHRITGSAPTGSDAYARIPYVSGIGAAWQNLIFPYRDDLAFVSFDATVHSLKATAAYGDFNEVALSRPIHKFLERANFARLNQGWAASIGNAGLALITLPVDGSTTCNALLVMDYRFDTPRWSYWPDFTALSLCTGIDPSSSNRRTIFAGGTDGYLRRYFQSARLIDAETGYRMKAQTPFMDYGEPFKTKTLGEAYLRISPKNNGDIDFNIRRDSQNAQTFEISQAAGDPLGTVSGTNFTLGVSALAEATVIERFFEAEQVGDFRQIQYEILNDVAGEDVEVHGFGATIEIGAISTENNL